MLTFSIPSGCLRIDLYCRSIGDTPPLTTKAQVFLLSPKLQAVGQVQATAFFIVNSQDGLELAHEWASLSKRVDLFDDSSNAPSHYCRPGVYLDHRHDQSVLSLLIKATGIPLLSDELNQERSTTLAQLSLEGVRVPIVATRHKGNFSTLSMNPVARAVRAIEGLMP
jgi:hypothetical protein